MWFEYFIERIGGPIALEATAPRPRRVDAVCRGQGRARRHCGNPINFYSVTASGHSDDEYVNALVGAGDLPAVADIDTRLEGTKKAVLARYAFGVQR